MREGTRERRSRLGQILIGNSRFHSDLKHERRSGRLEVFGNMSKPAVKEVGKENWKVRPFASEHSAKYARVRV